MGLTDAQVALKLGLTVGQVAKLHTDRGLNNESLVAMPRVKLEQALWRLDHPKPDSPEEAAQFRLLLQQGSPTTPLDPDALVRARQQTKDLARTAAGLAPVPAPAAIVGGPPAAPPRRMIGGMPVGELVPPSAVAVPAVPGVVPVAPDAEAGMLRLDQEPLPFGVQLPSVAAVAPGSPGGIIPANWKWLGPGNIGGSTRAIVIHPTHPNIMWLGAVAGGVWKSVNGGTTWAPLADFMASLNVSCMAIDPTHPDILYAGTGEGFYGGDALRGNGIFKTTDGGATWTNLASTTGTVNGPNFFYVNRLAVSRNGKVLLAATRSGIYRSTDGGSTFIALPAPVNVDVRYVAFAPVDSGPTPAAIASGPAGQAYYSTNGGLSFTVATGIAAGSGRVELAYAAKAPTSVVYASVDHNSGEVYRSVDGGKTYILVNTGTNYLGGQGWYDNTVWAGDPTNSNIVVVGGLDLYRSTNGGSTFTQISQWWLAPASAHADHHAIVAHPGYNGSTNRTVYFGNDGGIYKASDVLTVAGSSGWQELNHNYGVTQFYGGAGNATSGRIVGGTQDNGSMRYSPPPGVNTGPQDWTTMFGGDGGFSAADPTNPNFFYGEYVYLQIHRSINAGASSTYIHGAGAPSGISEAGSRANFIAPFILDPNNSLHMYGGGLHVWRSVNVTASTPKWESIGTPSSDTAAAGNFNYVSALAVPSGHSNILWAAHNNGDVYRTANALGPNAVVVGSWTRVDAGPKPLPNRYCTRITISRTNPKIVYACFGGYVKDNIWKTTDDGATWTSISAPLPEATVHDVKEHPSNANVLYAATDVGLFVSENAGVSWYPTNEGPASVAVDELFWMNKVLVAVTHGRGMFWIDLGAVLPAGEGGVAAPAVPAAPVGQAVERSIAPFSPR